MDVVSAPVEAAGGSSAHRTPAPDVPVVRSVADRRMRRLLGLPADAPKQSIFGTESVFGRSIAVSAIRCLITYVFLPILAPVVKLTGTIGSVLGLVLGAVSMVAIVFSMRRFFAADHKWRWGYSAVGGGILVLLVVAGITDLVNLLG